MTGDRHNQNTVLFLGPEELKGLINMDEAVAAVEQGYKEAAEHPIGNAPGIVHRDHVRVAQPRHRLGLSDQPTRHRIGIGARGRAHQLERHATLESKVGRRPDHRHRPGPDLGLQPVPIGDRVPGPRLGRRSTRSRLRR